MSISNLAKQANKGLDETLLHLWEAGIDHVTEPEDILVGKKLRLAKRALGIPNSGEITSISYWQNIFHIDEPALRKMLSDLDIQMSSKAYKLPTGAIRKLKSEALKRITLLQYVPPKHSVWIKPKVSLETIRWRIVGHVQEVIKLTKDEVVKIHERLVLDFLNHSDPIDPPGIRSADILASAIHRQYTSMANEEKYPTVEMVSAALTHSLVHNHPFYNGNKRTALVSLLVILDRNGLVLTCSEKDLFKFILQIAQHKIIGGDFIDLPDREVLGIAEWLKENSRLLSSGDRPLSYLKLCQVLRRYKCYFENSTSGNNVKIIRVIESKGFLGKRRYLSTNIARRSNGKDVSASSIDKIRYELELDDGHGIDSGAFYEERAIAVDDFIVKYRKTLSRLSKL